MARRKKNLTLEEELLSLKEEDKKCEDEIKRFSNRKKELKQLIEQKQMEVLHQAMMKSGKSIDEVIALINRDAQEERSEKNIDETVDLIHERNE